MKRLTAATIIFLALASSCNRTVEAESVLITITGEVEFNQVGGGFLAGVDVGDAATLSFTVDSNNFVDSLNFPTRGYVINQDSFALTLGGDTIGLQDPYPAGETPLFVIRDNDPAVDGFFVSNSVNFPIGVPIDQNGIIDQFQNNFSVTYDGGTLSSLDILDATGDYGFAGLSVFNWTIDDGPFQPVGINFSGLSITASSIPEPSTSALIVLISIATLGRSARFRR